jgi:hypothetical protein
LLPREQRHPFSGKKMKSFPEICPAYLSDEDSLGGIDRFPFKSVETLNFVERLD